ncbi:MAG: class II aldolase/adducin family protein [Burkholderiales bacterium]
MSDTQQVREKLALACKLLYMEGLIDHGGLVGARVPGTSNMVLNPREMRGTPGRHPGLMEADDMVVVDATGKRIEGSNNPPSETPIFTGVFGARPDVMAVFHLHLQYATLFSIVGKPLQAVGVTGARFGETVPVHADPTLIQRPEQGVEVAATLGQRPAVILRGHGAVIVGASIEEAFVASVMFEDNALRQYRACQIGTPQTLRGAELAEAEAQIAHPKVTAKMWHFYLMKAKSDGIIQ